mmetsp:Transcript_3295/g.7138  ORF Transcript_3295/g.7138 Transcript_3295/m.7138 type:complete len:91 (-) Transcript_3295:895-1167(-)
MERASQQEENICRMGLQTLVGRNYVAPAWDEVKANGSKQNKSKNTRSGSPLDSSSIVKKDPELNGRTSNEFHQQSTFTIIRVKQLQFSLN